MDGLTLTKLVMQSSDTLASAKLNRITIAPDALTLHVYTPGGMRSFVLSASASAAPWFAPAPERAGRVDDKLAVIHGATIAAVTPKRWDRQFSINLRKRKASGKVVSWDIVFELMGRPAACFLVSDAGRITWRLNDAVTDPDRDTGIGALYQPPKPNKRFTLESPGDAVSFAELVGFAPHTTAYAEAVAGDMAFPKACAHIRSLILDDAFFYVDEKNRPVPFKFSPDAEPIPAERLHEHLAAPKRSGSKKNVRGQLDAYYAKEEKRLKKLIAGMESDLEKAMKWPDLMARAELFKANFAALEEHFRRGGDLTLKRYTENGVEEVRAEPPEADNAKAAVADLFKKAGKLERSVPILEDRLTQARQMLASARDMRHNIAETDDEAALSELQDDIDVMAGKNRRGDGRKRQEKPTFATYALPGATAWSGSSSVSNHRLVFGFAKPDDTWLHARNIPSAHVILRTNDGTEPTDEQVLTAARIVAARSKAKLDRTVPVDWTMKKYVKHPKGAPPGYVIYKEFSTVDAEPMSAEELETLGETGFLSM